MPEEDIFPDQDARDDDARRMAVEAVGRSEHPRAVEMLIRALGDHAAQVRHAASRALKARGEGALATAVLDALVGETRPLAQLADPRALAPLARVLADPSHPARAAAATALGQLKAPEALPSLLAALEDADPGIRRVAALALGELGLREAADPLLLALADAHSMVREAAVHALGRTGGARAVLALAAALQDEYAAVRLAVAEALPRLGLPAGAALDVLRTCARHDQHGSIRAACERAVVEIEAILRSAPTELEAAPGVEGRGTELEAAPRPEGTGTELEAAAVKGPTGPEAGR